jgi:hypothetical protein
MPGTLFSCLQEKVQEKVAPGLASWAGAGPSCAAIERQPALLVSGLDAQRPSTDLLQSLARQPVSPHDLST